MKQAIAALNRANILRLTKTYVTLSLADLAAQAGLPSPADAEKALLNMVRLRRLFSTPLHCCLFLHCSFGPTCGNDLTSRVLVAQIDDGQIFATINQKDGMVSFLEDPEEYDSTSVVSQLDGKIKEIVTLSGLMAEASSTINARVSHRSSCCNLCRRIASCS